VSNAGDDLAGGVLLFDGASVITDVSCLAESRESIQNAETTTVVTGLDSVT
jgi:hypothetical protein